jgi:hypothetical protein
MLVDFWDYIFPIWLTVWWLFGKLPNNQRILETLSATLRRIGFIWIIPYIKMVTCWAQFVLCLQMWLYEDEKSSRKSCQTVGNDEALSPIGKCISREIRRLCPFSLQCCNFINKKCHWKYEKNIRGSALKYVSSHHSTFSQMQTRATFPLIANFFSFMKHLINCIRRHTNKKYIIFWERFCPWTTSVPRSDLGSSCSPVGNSADLTAHTWHYEGITPLRGYVLYSSSSTSNCWLTPPFTPGAAYCMPVAAYCTSRVA